MNRTLMIAVWALSAMTSVLFAGYWASYAITLWRVQNGGTELPAALVVLAVIAAVVVVTVVVLVVVVLVGRTRLSGLRRRFPGPAIVPVRARGLDEFALAHRRDTGRQLPTPRGTLYAAFGPRMLTLLTSDGEELLSFDTEHARLRVVGGGAGAGGAGAAGGAAGAGDRSDGGDGFGIGGSAAALAVEVAGYPRLSLGFPRAWSLGALTLPADDVAALVARTRMD